MTPAQIETAARRKYNSTTSNFYSSAEVYDLIYQAECEIARETIMLEGTSVISGGSIQGTRSYAFPTGVLELKRVEYDGMKLEPIDFRQDDAATFMNSNSTAQGVPQYYSQWDSTLYLRPIPSTSALQIRLYYFKDPALVTSPTQVLEVPAIWHMAIVDFVAAWLAFKDENTSAFDRYMTTWTDRHIPAMKAWCRKRKVGDSFKVVKDMDTLADTILGNI